MTISKSCLLAVRHLALVLPLAACADTAGTSPQSVKLVVAPLDLAGIGDACFDLRVTNAAAGAGDVVWARGTPGLNGGLGDPSAICSSDFGNGAGGDITYIGPCDADGPGGERINSITVWFDGLYDDDGGYLAPDGSSGWQNPCVDTSGDEVGCTLDVLCVENADALVSFNFTVMRDAQQGFFDIAVNFEDVFCSAKLDTCYDTGEPDEREIALLFGGDDTRDWTGVFGLACTAGTGDVETTLLYSNIAITCTGGDDDVSFALDPTLLAGNQVASDGDHVLHYAVYRGFESLGCGTGSCHKAYWNLAFSLDDLELAGGDCALALSATATDGNAGFSNGLPTGEGLSYPYIDVAAPLTDDGTGFCQTNQLNGSDVVVTTYHGDLLNLPPPPTMCHQFDASSVGPVAGADCSGATVGEVQIQLNGPFRPDVEFTLSVPGAPDRTQAASPGSNLIVFSNVSGPSTITITGPASNPCDTPSAQPFLTFDVPGVGVGPAPYQAPFVGGTLVVPATLLCTEK